MPPTSQKYRPIAVVLDGESVMLTLRPEDLSWSEPSRTTVQNTLGSAWVDSFGPGIAQITISGTTGWAGRHGMGADGPDWLEQFTQLHTIAFKKWHAKVEASKDPESVVMMFVDVLDSRVARVVPMNFVLRRNKARPLLMQYTIMFSVVRDLGSIDTAAQQANGPLASPMALPFFGSGAANAMAQLASIQKTIAQISSFALMANQAATQGSVGSAIGIIGNVFGPQVAASLSAITGTVGQGLALASQLGLSKTTTVTAVPASVTKATATAAKAAGAGANLALGLTGLAAAGSYVVGGVNYLTDRERVELMYFAATMRAAATLMLLGFQPDAEYPDYDAVYGAANGSDITVGGAPAGDGNPFDTLTPVETPLVRQSVAALRSARILIHTDPVLDAQMSAEAIAEHWSTVANGTAFAQAA